METVPELAIKQIDSVKFILMQSLSTTQAWKQQQ